MAKEGTIVRATAEGGSLTDWDRVDAMTQEEVERLAEEEDGPFEDWVPIGGGGGVAFVDADILEWFRASGPGWEPRLNAALRAFVDGQRRG